MIIAAVLLLLIYLVVRAYNRIVRYRNQVENALAGTDTILKKRFDLIPNLVHSVKQYMNFEEATLSKITALRTSVLQCDISDPQRMVQENELSSLLGKVLVAVENYPDLKSNTNMLHLQQSLMEIEEQISAARRTYNASVMEYNNAIETFPASIVAGIMGASRKASFEINATEKENFSVKELFDAK